MHFPEEAASVGDVVVCQRADNDMLCPVGLQIGLQRRTSQALPGAPTERAPTWKRATVCGRACHPRSRAASWAEELAFQQNDRRPDPAPGRARRRRPKGGEHADAG